MRTRNVLFILLGVAMTSALVGGMFFLVLIKLRDGLEAQRLEREARDEAERRDVLLREREQSRKDAAEMLSNPVPPSDQEAAVFRSLFDNLGRALAAGDVAATESTFDVDRFAAVLNLPGILRSLPGGDTPANRAAFIKGMKQEFGQSLIRNTMFRWERTDIRRVRWSAKRDEAVVIAYHHPELQDDRAAKIRWWLVKQWGGWKVYDLEDLDMGMRLSAAIEGLFTAIFVRELVADPERMKAIFDSMRESMTAALVRKDLDEADRLLQPARAVNLPPPLAAVREMIEAMILLDRGAQEAALKRLDEADRLQQDIPVFNQVRAGVSAAAGRYGEALTLIRKYLNEVGPDADAFATEGYALEGLDRFPEAINSYRKALNELPGLPEALDGLRRVLDNDAKSELASYLTRAPKPLEAYDSLSGNARDNGDTACLDVLKTWLRKSHPNDPRTIRLELHDLIEGGNAAEAGITLRQRLASDLNDELKRTALHAYLQPMIDGDRHLEAYAAVPDDHAALAFRTLADDINERPIALPLNPADRDLKLQRELIALHHKRTPDDPWLLYFEGSVLVLERRLAEAERKFAAGQAKLPPRPKAENSDPESSEHDWGADRIRRARVLCLFEMKEGLRAYAEIGPAADTFAQLAFNYYWAKDEPGLEALLAAHRKREPKDLQLLYWSGELLYLREKYTESCESFLTFITEAQDNEPNRWQAIDRCVRGYLRAKLPGKARDAVVTIGIDKVPAGLRAAVHLANGRPALAEEIISAGAKGPGGYQWLYYDEDFARLMKLPEFDSLRKKYPDTRNDPSGGVPG